MGSRNAFSKAENDRSAIQNGVRKLCDCPPKHQKRIEKRSKFRIR
jgi:hypothetical protein